MARPRLGGGARRGVVTALALGTLWSLVPRPAAGQWLDAAPAAPRWVPEAPPGAPGQPGAAGRSLLVPGWGQHALGQRRGWAYAAAEVALWVFWIDRRAGAADARDGYRDLAWREARQGSGPRIDGDWAYYETMSKWTRSGLFDTDPATPGIQPEEDGTTYNGSIWKLARDVYFRGGQPAPGDPAFADAVAYYQKRAYAGGYRWDWTDRADALHRYKDLIRTSDDHYRQATQVMGGIIANHLLSGADAFVSARVPGNAALRLLPPNLGATLSGWRLVLSLEPPR